MGRFALRFPLLCLITDPTRPDLRAAVELALAAGVDMVQLRSHQLTGLQLYELACDLRRSCRDYGAAFLVNDRLDIGLACGADGFQLGAQSFPLAIARELVGENFLLGASVHSLAEAREAAAHGADFLLAGTIFASSSHPGAAGQGPGLLTEIKRALPACPLIAIGGITATNAGEVMEAGADGVAVISAILAAENILQAVRELRHALLKGGSPMDEIPPQTAADIPIIVNGQERLVRDGSTIGDLLRELAIAPARVVAQLDGRIIPREEFARTGLCEGCRLELITLVGGG